MLQMSRSGIRIKSADEIEGMRRAGRLASECLQWLTEETAPGICTNDLHDLQMDFCRRHKVTPAPLGYKGFPKSLCTSINHVICHGIPSKKEVLNDGDTVGIDVTLIVDGYHGDNAATVAVGTPSAEDTALMQATLESLRLSIEAVRANARWNAIGRAIQDHVEPLGFSVVRDFVGHGIGKNFHEEPQILHYFDRRHARRMKPGMIFTIEPMINLGTHQCRVLDDDWTAVTTDGKTSAQYEHTLVVTEEGAEILTCQNGTGAWEPPGRYTP